MKSLYIILCNSMVDINAEAPQREYKGEGLRWYGRDISGYSSRAEAKKAIRKTEKLYGEDLLEKYGFKHKYRIVRVLLEK